MIHEVACWSSLLQVVVEKKLKRERGLSRHDVGREAFVAEVRRCGHAASMLESAPSGAALVQTGRAVLLERAKILA